MQVKSIIRSESFSRGMLLSVIFNAGAKALLFVLTILIAHFFGTSRETDVYFFIYAAMILLSGFINAVDITVLVPVSIRIRLQEGDRPAMGFLNTFLLIYLLAGLLFAGLVLTWTVPLFSFFSRFSEADILQYRVYFILGSWLFAVQVLTNYMNNILTSLRFFTVPMIISAFNSCIVIAGLLLLHREYDELSVLLSAVAACTINLLLLLILMKRLLRWDFGVYSHPGKYKVWPKIGFTELGQAFTLASNYFPLYLLSGLGNGMLSAMSYGKQLADVPNSLVTAQVTNVGGVALNEEAAGSDPAKLADHFSHTGRLLLFIMIPAGLYLFVLSRPVVEFLYQRGRFGDAAVDAAATFLQLFSLTLFVIALNAWVSRLFIALQAIRQAFIYQLLMNSVFMLITWMAVQYYGAYGYGYAFILFNLVNFILMYFICRKLASHIDYTGLVIYSVKLLLLNGAIAALFWLLLPYVQIPVLLQLVFSFLVWATILLLVRKKIVTRNS